MERLGVDPLAAESKVSPKPTACFDTRIDRGYAQATPSLNLGEFLLDICFFLLLTLNIRVTLFPSSEHVTLRYALHHGRNVHFHFQVVALVSLSNTWSNGHRSNDNYLYSQLPRQSDYDP